MAPGADAPIGVSSDQGKTEDDTSETVLATAAAHKLLFRQMSFFNRTAQENERLEKENKRLRLAIAEIPKLLQSHRSKWIDDTDTIQSDVSMMARELHFYRMESISETRSTAELFKKKQAEIQYRIAERDNFKAGMRAAIADGKRDRELVEHVRVQMDDMERDIILADKAKELAEKNLKNALFIQTNQMCMKCKVSEKSRKKLIQQLTETIISDKQKKQALDKANAKILELQARVDLLETDCKKMDFERNGFKNDNIRLFEENENYRQIYGLPKTPQRLFSPVVPAFSVGVQVEFKTSNHAVQTDARVDVVSCGVQTEKVELQTVASKKEGATTRKNVDLREKSQPSSKVKEEEKKTPARSSRIPMKRNSRDALLSPPPVHRRCENRSNYWDAVGTSDSQKSYFPAAPQPISLPPSPWATPGRQPSLEAPRYQEPRPTDHRGFVARQPLLPNPPMAYLSSSFQNQPYVAGQQGLYPANSYNWDYQSNNRASMNNPYNQNSLHNGSYQGNVANANRLGGIDDLVRWNDLPQ